MAFKTPHTRTLPTSTKRIKMRPAFGKAVSALAAKDPNIVLITGDVEQEMKHYRANWPDRFFNMGICEQSIVSCAAGMALAGMRPIVYSITPFILERAFEQIKIDVDYNKLPVILVCYDDYPTYGITHRPLDARAMVRLFRNVESYFPQNAMQAEKAIFDAYLLNGPAMVFLKRDSPTQI